MDFRWFFVAVARFSSHFPFQTPHESEPLALFAQFHILMPPKYIFQSTVEQSNVARRLKLPRARLIYAMLDILVPS